MITITDIAKALDISPATVSRAMNQSRLVTPELTKNIHRTAEKLGYKKRPIRRHRGRAILNIKLVLPRHEEPERALFYDLAALIEGIHSGFKHCGINLLCETASPKFKPYPHKKGGDLNGFIFAFNRPSTATLAELEKFGTPFVVLNRQITGLPCVASENAEGISEIIRHLNERRPDLKPAFVSLKGLGQIGEERLAGMAAACASRGIAFDLGKDVIHFDEIASINSETIRPMAESYNALVCVNDIVGTVVVSELDRLGVSVPLQVAVTGFDNSPVRRLSRPILTSVSMPIGKLAGTAATMLEEQIIEHKMPQGITRVPGILIVGESS
ncbi:LacI family DNA-binding transcriptional regulator [Akkermansiaceae bacterium]|nr:LacI family DNA-binding transcriptional regulator [Akkermansiaceae bacterium]